MTQFLFANNAGTTLAGPIANNATSLSLAAGTGSIFPNPGSGQQFSLTLVSAADTAVREIVYCTSRATDVCTIIRGQEGTTPTAFVAGDAANGYWTAGQSAAMTQITQLQQQAPNYAVDTGSANAYAVALNPAPASFAFLVGVPIRVKIANTNTGASTLSVNGLTAAITNPGGTSVLSGMLAAGALAQFVYDGTSYEMLSPGAGIQFAPVGQCRLIYTSPTVVSLIPYGGNGLRINGQTYAIPQAGVSLFNTGLGAGTFYYVYAGIVSGNISLLASVTTHVTDATPQNYGVEIMFNDNLYTLVGAVQTNSSSQFVSTIAIQAVISWFNRRGLILQGLQVIAGTGDTGGYISPGILGTSADVYFLNWADEGIIIHLSGSVSNSIAGTTSGVALVIDGGSIGSGTLATSSIVNASQPVAATIALNTSEGTLHHVQPGGYVTAGTGLYSLGITGYYRG